MPRTKTTPCSRCGELRWPTTKGELLVCRACRKIEPSPYGLRSRALANCAACGIEFLPQKTGLVCCSRECGGINRRVRPDADRRVVRHLRERAPGLSQVERNRLLAKWKRQGRSCFYCVGRCESIDHVVPLSRGGTNGEGNLVPACRKCNGSKGYKLLIVWRQRQVVAA